MAKELHEIRKTSEDQWEEMLGILRGENGDPGLLHDVRSLKEGRARWDKIGWIVATVAIGQLVVLVFRLLQDAGK